jgi:hypothetical protein
MKSVIEWINDIRKDFDGAPVEDFEKGDWGSPMSCPISKTIAKDLDVRVYTTRPGVTVVRIEDGQHTRYPLSKEADRFIDGFDGRRAHQELSDE